MTDRDITSLERSVFLALERDYNTPSKEIIQTFDLSAPIKEYHLETYADLLDVCLLTGRIALSIGLSPLLGVRSGITHDLGKIGISIGILNKTYGISDASGHTDEDCEKMKYSADDHEKMKNHVEIGREILMKQDFPTLAFVAHSHHSWKINDPYPKTFPSFPQQLRTPDQKLEALLCSRITSLADQYQASHRNNGLHGDKPLTSLQIRTKLFRENPSQEYLLKKLYAERIFRSS